MLLAALFIPQFVMGLFAGTAGDAVDGPAVGTGSGAIFFGFSAVWLDIWDTRCDAADSNWGILLLSAVHSCVC